MKKSPLQHFKQCLEKRHLYFTSQREEVVRRVLSWKGHFGVDDIYEWARHRGLSVGRSTIYRTLQLMAECNLLEERDFQRGYKVYEVSLGKEKHEHMTCVDCDKVIEFQAPSITQAEKDLMMREGFTPLYHSFVVYGLCDECTAKRSNKEKQKVS